MTTEHRDYAMDLFDCLRENETQRQVARVGTRAGEAGDSAESAPTGVDPVSPGAFPSAPIEGETKATVELVANGWRSDPDWARFQDACYHAALFASGSVDPNKVRVRMTNHHGLTIEPRRYSAFWSRAASKNGFLVADGWTLNDDVKGGNRGKPQRMYRLRT